MGLARYGGAGLQRGELAEAVIQECCADRPAYCSQVSQYVLTRAVSERMNLPSWPRAPSVNAAL
jgi:hypothetical protein